ATLRGAVALLGQRSQPDAWITVDTGRLQSLDTLAFLRTWALHAPLPAFWGYRTMAWGGGWEKLPFRRLGAVKRFAQHNEELADSALLANDPLAAMNRAREIIAASRHLIDQPFAMDMLFGTYILQRGARLFARSAQQGDEPALASAAKRLDAIAGANYRLGIGERRALLNMGADPSGRSLLAIAGDTALPPGVRVEAPLEAMLRSACLNPREMMFGLSRARSDMFDEMLLALDDIARMREVAPSLRARLALFDAPAAFLENLKGARMKESLVSLLVPPVLRDRVKFCQLSG
ncbi:MAG: hypothetical protein ABIW79_02850, partial [Gemmatimonas sp.]